MTLFTASDVLKLDGLCVVAVRYAADSVRPHPFIRDTVLRRFSFFVRAVSAGNGRFDLLLISAGQLFLCLYRLHSFFLGFPEHPMLPFFMLAMYEKHGQPLEKIVGNILKVAVIRPKQRPYQTNNFYAVLKRQEMLDKEVYDIVHRNKKMAASDVRKNRGKNCAAGKDKEKAVPRR